MRVRWMSGSASIWAWVLVGLMAGCAHFGDRLPSLSREDLGNAEYLSEFAVNGKARLRDGVYREKAASGSFPEVVITLSDLVARGDLDGDGVEDAAVILVVQSGGSGTFYYLCAVLNQDGTPLNEATVYLGDRIQVRKLSIDGGWIEIEMLVQGPGDPMVKPTRRVRRAYELSDRRLIQKPR